MPAPEHVMTTYVALWNATDEQERGRLAEAVLTEDAALIYPTIAAQGRDAVVAASMSKLSGHASRRPAVSSSITAGFAPPGDCWRTGACAWKARTCVRFPTAAACAGCLAFTTRCPSTVSRSDAVYTS